MSKLLDDDRVATWLAGHPGWEREGDAIRRSVQCPTFAEGISFVDRVAVAAEEADHHPDIDIRWRTVTFVLSTHSEGGLTDSDLRLAERIDELTPG